MANERFSSAKLTGTTSADALQVTAPTLTVGTESSDVIAVTFASPVAAISQFHAQLYDANMLAELVTAFTMAETGAGSEVSTTAKPGLLFKTDATGAATLSVTDVAGASGLTTRLVIHPVADSAGSAAVAGCEATLTFD